MKNIIRQYNESDGNTKWLIWTGIMYGVVIILTTMYAYARIYWVDHTATQIEQFKSQNTEAK